MVPQIFTKHSQNVCLINTHVLMYQYAIFNSKLWKSNWFCGVFWYIHFDDHSCLKCCISTKLSQMVSLIQHIFLYVDIPDVTKGYGRFSGLVDSLKISIFDTLYFDTFKILWKINENNFNCHLTKCNCVLWKYM